MSRSLKISEKGNKQSASFGNVMEIKHKEVRRHVSLNFDSDCVCNSL